MTIFGGEDRKLEFRLWPYTRYNNRIEIHAFSDIMPEIEGLYFDFDSRKWMPQSEEYRKKAEDFQKDYDRCIELIMSLR